MGMEDFPKPKEEKGPELSFYFSAHSNAEDFEKMREEFDRADVYISEQHGWTPDDLQAIRDIATGKRKPLHLAEGRPAKSAGDLEDEIIYNSHKPIYFVDIPSGHELENTDEGQNDLERATNDFSLYDINNAKESLISAANKNAAFLQKKDSWIAKNIGNKIPEILKNEPALKNKENIKILIQFGASHFPIRRMIDKPMKTTRVKSWEQGLAFSYYDKLIQKIRFKRDIPEDLPLKALFEVYFKKIFSDEIKKIPNQLFVRAFKKTFDDNLKMEMVNKISVGIAYQQLTNPSFSEKDALKISVKNIMNVDLETFFKNINNIPSK